LNLFWQYIPFVPDFTVPKIVLLAPLFTPEFGPFLLYINILGVSTIAVQLLYLALRQKWIPAFLEAGVTFLNGLLAFWIFTVFPFNPGYGSMVHAGIRVFLALVMFGCLVGTAQHLWHAVKYFLQAGAEKREAV
ncbi:MAG TPA: hypothetical protein VMC61_03085, partial [Methanocella sp.]|nr:hypothetical protein [Methanocella sp.]